MKPLIITAAITGGGPPGARAPHLPVTPRQIAEEAVAAWRAGAAVLHLHARAEDGTPTADPAAHRTLIDRIRSAGCDAVINFSCGDGGGRFNHAQRLAIIDTGCDMVSFTASSYNSGNRLYDNGPAYLRSACQRMQATGVKPEIEILDTGSLDCVARMVAAGELRGPLFCLLGFGIPGAMPADPVLLPLLRQRLPADAEWGVACGGDHASFLLLQMTALAQCGHVRCGMEDQPYLYEGKVATSNRQLVEQWVRSAETWGRPVATVAQARALLGFSAIQTEALA